MVWTRFILSVVALVLAAALSACTRGDTPGDAGADAAAVPDLGAPDAAADLGVGRWPLITEFLAKNQAGLTDEDGARSDWIEIHNPDLRPFDLSGFHLTDTASNPRRWAFPDGTVLAPGAYLVVFASGKDRAVAGQPLHTSFSLSDGDRGAACARRPGGYLALTDRRGVALPPTFDPYPAQTADVSYGALLPDVAAGRAFFTTPTPGAKNDPAAAPAERVVFSPQSGTFSASAAVSVALRVASPTATVRYTTNRARPIAAAGLAGTFTADAATEVCTLTAHGLTSGDLVRVSGPPPLVSTVNYFVTVRDADTFQLSIAPGGPPVDLSASGDFELRRDAATGTAATTGVITTTKLPHAFFAGDAVKVRAASALPAGLSADATYYVVPTAATTLRLSLSPALTPTVAITGTGAVTVAREPSRIYDGPLSLTRNTRVRARAFEPGRPSGPIGSEMYFALDAAAQEFTSTLPLVVSHTFNEAMTNNTVVDGYLMIFEPKAPDNLARLTNPPDLATPCSLERHGSSTAVDPKFSMAVETQDEDGLDQSCSPLGMPAYADWLMHAPYKFDKAMLRNDLIYRLSNDAGRYAVRTRLVEHLHNEQSLVDTIEGAVTGVDYFGVYSFMERISRGEGRVNVENLTIADNALPALQGGYMFKADRLDTGEIGIRPLPGQSFGNAGTGGPGANILSWVNPREISNDPWKRVTPAQSDWLRGHLGDAWAALSGADSADPDLGYARYFDVASVIDYHILNAAPKNPDAFRLSAFWHKPRFGKIVAGPVWDFDRTQGSTDGRDFDWGSWVGAGDFFAYPWYQEMFADPNFWQRWIDRLHELRQGPLSTPLVHAYIDDFASQLNPGDGAETPAKRSARRWSATAPRTSASNAPITSNLFDGQYSGEVAWLKYWWQQRLLFLDSQVTRPAEPSLLPGPVPAGSTVALTTPSGALPGVKIYYTLDGTDPRSPDPAAPLSPSAIEYTDPIVIRAATRLFVRAWNPLPLPYVGSGFSAPTILSYTVK